MIEENTNVYNRTDPGYDKELLWTNRKKYLGHKRAIRYISTFDVIVGLVSGSIVRNILSGIASNPKGAFSVLLLIGLIAASVITVTCLENKKVIVISMIIFAACAVIFSLLFGSVLYLIFFAIYAAQMLISIILAENLAYLKTQFGYPYFSESLVENDIYIRNKRL